MTHFRRKNESLRRGEFFKGDSNSRNLKDIDWHGCKLYQPGWNDPASKVLAFTIASFHDDQPDIHVMMNMDYVALDFEIPPLSDRSWYRFADTSLEAPNDISDNPDVKIDSSDYTVSPYSVVILISK